MKEKLTLDERTLNRVPSFIVLLLLLMLGGPAVLLYHFDIELTPKAQSIAILNDVNTNLIETEIRGYFMQILLQWSAFSIAFVTMLLGFTQYQLTKNKVTLVLSFSILFSGLIEAAQTLLIDGITPQYIDKANLDAFIWSFYNTGTAGIFLIGFGLVLLSKPKTNMSLFSFILIFALIITAALTFIYVSATNTNLPQMWFKEGYFSRPYDFIYVCLNLIIALFLYPLVYKKYPQLISNCIFYMAVTQVISGVYLIMLSSGPFDTAFNISYFLRIIYYFIPFSALVINYALSYHDMLKAKEKLQYIASHDPLTDLLNRYTFEKKINQSITSALENDKKFALFIIDVDDFKAINDTYGHVIGDFCLSNLAKLLKARTHNNDILCRVGGDEFILIAKSVHDMGEAKKLANQMIADIEKNNKINHEKFNTTVSIGIALFPDNGMKAHDLLKNADAAMYQAKNSGKNTCQIFFPDQRDQVNQI